MPKCAIISDDDASDDNIGSDDNADFGPKDVSDGDADSDDNADFGHKDASETLRLRELYRGFGILDDDHSSVVSWYIPDNGADVLPHIWSLRRTEMATVFPRCSDIYVVENPAVFSTVLDALRPPFPEGREMPALLCTSGPASAAAIRWMQRCFERSGEACRLYYSGDFDIKGLVMGQTLLRLFPDRFVFWRFDAETYGEAVSSGYPGPEFEAGEADKLSKMNVPWDANLCARLRETGTKVHQESFVDRLVDDFAGAVFVQ